ncbi:MAG: hypothetical protein PHU85_06685 [Phycisphaerae bacterium]|nr:hypothetical protein [Phycisphaerae bacterium]
MRCVSTITIVLLALLLLTACQLNHGPTVRNVSVLPAILGGADPLAISPDWAPKLPDRAGNKADEVLGFRLFDRYLFPGEPATGLMRINRRNLSGRQRVHVEVWDDAGLNLLWQAAVKVQPDETYLLQIAPLADESFVDQSLQIRLHTNVFLVTERVYILPRPRLPAKLPKPVNQMPEWVSAGAFPIPLPGGPLAPNDEPIVLLATPGEVVIGAVVLWPTQAVAGAASFQSAGQKVVWLQWRYDAKPRYDWPEGGIVTTRQTEPEELAPGRSNIFIVGVQSDGVWRFTESPNGYRVERPIHLVVLDLPLLPARPGLDTAQARYLATLEAMLKTARNEGNFQTRLLADRIEKLIDRAAEYHANQPACLLGKQFPADEQFPFKLRWMILRSMQQLKAAGVAMPAAQPVPK